MRHRKIMRKIKKVLSVLLAAAACMGLASCGGREQVLSADNPVTITVWTYYNGGQDEGFTNLVNEFNNSVGADKGIIVDSLSQGSIDGVSDELMKAADDKIGAHVLPNLAMVYPGTAYDLKDILADYDNYFTKEELEQYIPGFIEEGRMVSGGPLMIFPVAKSTEVFMYNETDWAKFTEATGIKPEDVSTIESLTSAAEEYYNWTDSKTPDVPNDGKSLFGRDSVDNYMFVGMAQLGHDMFTIEDTGVKIDMDKDSMRTLWDNYYIPYIKGYFAAVGKFRSDDAKTGGIISFVGSSTGSKYFPDKVTLADDSSYEITGRVLPAPKFKEAKTEYSVQQGAGFCCLKGTKAEETASAEFLKWITDEKQNVYFSTHSGYLPVKSASNDIEVLKKAFPEGSDPKALEIENLEISSKILKNDPLYVGKPFAGQSEIRNIFKNSIADIANADRQAVIEALNSGKSRDEATESFAADEYFDEWYDNLAASVESVVNQNK